MEPTPKSKKAKALAEKEDLATAFAIWSEDILLDPGHIRYPIRVVLVDDLFQTRFDRLVKQPEGSDPFVYRVLDHGIPMHHLDAGLLLEEVKKEIMNICRGKRLVVYDAWKHIGLFDFTEQQLSRLRVHDLKSSTKSKGSSGSPLPFWDLVRIKLGHLYTGKPGNYDTIELTDFVMSIHRQYQKEEAEQEES